jgi:D-glycero-D-manno-heptose 1,7-bisphosphate phosphatase
VPRIASPRGLIILDRDGTLIDIVRDEESGFVGVAFHPSQVRLLKGVREGLTRLRDAGFVFAIATNQPAPAKGQFSAKAVELTNAAVVEALRCHGIAIAHVAVCMHHPVGGTGGDAALVRDCDCRKPKSGLLSECLDVAGLTPADANLWMVGDSPGDIVAGQRLGLQTALVFDTKRCELCPLRFQETGCAGAANPSLYGPNLDVIASGILAAATSALEA